ncbi:MAG: hypothetical protein CM1200mP3_10570 [Chloroflexota bacterium]|nr:MAG: hypothetical protein CM1200mP3_10570 [Chloroflexota bacterium]
MKSQKDILKRWDSVNQKLRERMDKLKIGVVGLGHGETLIGANSSNLPLEVSSLCDINEDLVDHYGKARYCKGTSKLRGICVGSRYRHCRYIYPWSVTLNQIIQALDNGKHVMVTKSMVYTLEEAEK